VFQFGFERDLPGNGGIVSAEIFVQIELVLGKAHPHAVIKAFGERGRSQASE
jgi:hypothetical protein